MDETKSKTAPIPNQHNLMAEVPVRKYGKILGIMAIVLVAVVIVGGAVWYFIFNQPSNEPVVEIKTETQDSQEEESQTLTQNAYLFAQLPLDEKTNLAGKSLFAVDFKERKLSEVYKNNGAENPQIVGVTEKSFYFKVIINGQFREVVRYDVDTKKTESLFRVEAPYHYFGVKLSPDKNAIVFTETCSYECPGFDENSITKSDIKIYDIKTKTSKLLRSFSDHSPLFTISGPWLSPGFIALDYACACDGSPDLSTYKMINVDNGNVIEVMLADNTNTSQLNSTGTQIAYTVSEIIGDEEGETPLTIKSTVELKDIASGSSKTLLTSTNSQYEIIEWLDEESLLIKITHAEKFEGGLIGMYPIGKIDLGVIGTRGQSDNLKLFVEGATNPDTFGAVGPYILFANESPFEGQNSHATNTLSVYNYLKNENFILSMPPIFSPELIN